MPVPMLPPPPIDDGRMAVLNRILRAYKRHGTWSAYNRGCRCLNCRDAARTYRRHRPTPLPWRERRLRYLIETGRLQNSPGQPCGKDAEENKGELYR